MKIAINCMSTEQDADGEMKRMFEWDRLQSRRTWLRPACHHRMSELDSWHPATAGGNLSHIRRKTRGASLRKQILGTLIVEYRPTGRQQTHHSGNLGSLDPTACGVKNYVHLWKLWQWQSVGLYCVYYVNVLCNVYKICNASSTY